MDNAARTIPVITETEHAYLGDALTLTEDEEGVVRSFFWRPEETRDVRHVSGLGYECLDLCEMGLLVRLPLASTNLRRYRLTQRGVAVAMMLEAS